MRRMLIVINNVPEEQNTIGPGWAILSISRERLIKRVKSGCGPDQVGLPEPTYISTAGLKRSNTRLA